MALEEMKQRWQVVTAEDYARMDAIERGEYLHFLELLEEEQQAKFRSHPAYETGCWEEIQREEGA